MGLDGKKSILKREVLINERNFIYNLIYTLYIHVYIFKSDGFIYELYINEI